MAEITNFFAIIKKEYINLTHFTTRVQAKLSIFDYIEAWYNPQRIHSKLAYLSPIEFEELKIKSPLSEIENVRLNIKMGVNKIQL